MLVERHAPRATWTRTIRVLIADGAASVRSALRLYIKDCRSDAVVHEASSLREMRDVLASTTIDVALIDWKLPERGGIEALRVLRQSQPDARVIVLSGRPEAREEASTSQADAFVSKGDPPDELHRALESVTGCQDQFHRQDVDRDGSHRGREDSVVTRRARPSGRHRDRLRSWRATARRSYTERAQYSL